MKNSNRSVDERVRTLITSSVSDSLDTSLSSSSSSSSSSLFNALADGSSWKKKNVALATFPLLIRLDRWRMVISDAWRFLSRRTISVGNCQWMQSVRHQCCSPRMGFEPNRRVFATRSSRLTKVLLAMPRRRRYFSMAETRASGSIFTGPLFHCFNVLHWGWRTKLHFNWCVVIRRRAELCAGRPAISFTRKPRKKVVRSFVRTVHYLE